MTRYKAIELLTIAIEGFPADDNEDYYNAMELAIEALRHFAILCRALPAFRDVLLPGETKE